MTQELHQARLVVARAERRGLGEVEVVVRRTESALTRYARSEVHQDVVSDEQVLAVRVAIGGVVGQAVTGRLDEAGVDAALDRAAALARLGTGRWPGFPHHGAGIVDLGAGSAVPPAARASAVAAIVGAAGRVEVHGVVETVRESVAVAGSSGLLAATVRPSVWVVVLAVSRDGGTGYAEERAAHLEDVDVAALSRAACADAARTASAIAAPTHELPAVLSEHVTADLVAKTARLVFTGARVADGSSCFAPGRVLASELVDLVDDGHDPRGVPRPFDSEGIRRRRVPLLEHGVATGVVHDTATAGAGSTGHALGHPDAIGPLPLNLFLAPGADTDLVAGIDDGLLVRRVYYTNAVDARTVRMSGSTRDGLFRIRRGEVAEALAPARFSLSYLDLLRSVDGVGAHARTVSGWYGGVHVLGDVTVPPVRVGSLRLGV